MTLIELRKLATDWRDYKLNNTSSTAEHIGMLFLHKRNFENAVTPDVVISMLDQIQSVQAENDLLKANAALLKEGWQQSVESYVSAIKERDALAAKLVPLEADAERYRWLSHHLFATAHGYDTTIGIDSSDSRIWINGFASYDMDAAIDAAKGGQHEDA